MRTYQADNSPDADVPLSIPYPIPRIRSASSSDGTEICETGKFAEVPE